MSTHEHTLTVDRPVRDVYDQWTQFESYPSFMDDVEAVRQVDEATTHWRVKVAGVQREYDARIVEQRPDEVIAWHAVDGLDQGGTVAFEPVDPTRTRVTLRMDFDPQGFTEKAGDVLGVVDASVRSTLTNFKDFMENEQRGSDGWRGEIHGGTPTSGDSLSQGTPGIQTDVPTPPRELQE